MEIKERHSWNLTYKEAVELQNRLRKELCFSSVEGPVNFIAGADVSFSKKDNFFYAGITILDREHMHVVESVVESDITTFPYIPGLLSFREGPVLLKAFSQIKTIPDVIFFDGQGIAHPRGIGLACHIGLILGIPSLGCAKSRLYGYHKEVGEHFGDYQYLFHENDEVIGAVVRTKRSVKPLFISPGHNIDLDSCIQLVLECSRGYRIPEPVRRAHILVNRARLSDKRHLTDD
ncbi:MAG: deoxyribonuclease V [Thermodesulfobacteriota bacterium]|nr:deoxyribonuclease V [Thermodesulfobacteriota bacterium]